MEALFGLRYGAPVIPELLTSPARKFAHGVAMCRGYLIPQLQQVAG